MGRRQQQRRARKKAEAAAADTPTGNETSRAEAGTPSPYDQTSARALGDHWAARPGGKGERENARLVAQSIRWNTNADAGTFKQAAPEKLTIKEIAVMVTRQGMIEGDNRAKAHHVGNVLRMEAQNQRDDLSLVEPPAAPLTDELLRQLLAGVAGMNDDAGAIEAVYRVADSTATVVLPGGDGDGAGAE